MSSASVLFKFALSETENYGNNSTNILKNIFRPFIGATEVNFEKRIEILSELSNSKDIQELTLVLDILDATIYSDNLPPISALSDSIFCGPVVRRPAKHLDTSLKFIAK